MYRIGPYTYNLTQIKIYDTDLKRLRQLQKEYAKKLGVSRISQHDLLKLLINEALARLASKK